MAGRRLRVRKSQIKKDDRPQPGLLPQEKEEYWEISVYLDGLGAATAWGLFMKKTSVGK